MNERQIAALRAISVYDQMIAELKNGDEGAARKARALLHELTDTADNLLLAIYLTAHIGCIRSLSGVGIGDEA